jgi:signal peptidase I
VPILASSPRVAHSETEYSQVRGLGRQLSVAGGRFVISYLVSMLAWVLVPAVVMGWTPMVILSGSMAPGILPGDVVLIDPDSSNRSFGAVLAFTLEEGVIVMHRVTEESEPGIYVTKGDANREIDSTPVPEAAVLGQGRLLVPLIGYPKIWVQEGAAFVVAALVGVLLLLARKQRTTLLVAGGLLVGWLAFSATAAFADVSSNTGSSLTAATIQPPTNLSGSCPGGVAVGNPVPVNLTWTASATPGVTEYQVFYDAPLAGGGFNQIGTVTAPQTSFTHNIPSAQVALGEPHTYLVRAVLGPWVSADSAPETVTITEVLLVYSCS